MTLYLRGQSPETRFWARVYPGMNGCWAWRGAPDSDGYAQFYVNGRLLRAHRFAYELLRGPIPDGLQIDHLCRKRVCVNPAHMEIVTSAENTRRGTSFAVVNRAKESCPAGHPYDAANTVRYRGRRYCRACHNARSSRGRRLRREAKG